MGAPGQRGDASRQRTRAALSDSLASTLWPDQVWELATGQDITRFTPLAISRQMQGQQPQPQQGNGGPAGGAGDSSSSGGGSTPDMPPSAPHAARHIFASCTQLDPTLRPNALQLVEWLRGGKV